MDISEGFIISVGVGTSTVAASYLYLSIVWCKCWIFRQRMPVLYDILMARALNKMFLKEPLLDAEIYLANSAMLAACTFGATAIILLALHIKVILFIVLGVLAAIAFMIVARWIVDTSRSIGNLKKSLDFVKEREKK